MKFHLPYTAILLIVSRLIEGWILAFHLRCYVFKQSAILSPYVITRSLALLIPNKGDKMADNKRGRVVVFIGVVFNQQILTE